MLVQVFHTITTKQSFKVVLLWSCGILGEAVINIAKAVSIAVSIKVIVKEKLIQTTTTLLNLIGGVDRPTSGEIVIANQDIKELTNDELTKFRRKIMDLYFKTIIWSRF